MKRTALMIGLAAALALLAGTSTAHSDTVGGLTCGNAGGPGVTAQQLFHDVNGWSSNYWEYCGNGKTYMYELQYSNDENHWFDATGHTVKTSASCNNGCFKKMANASLPCSNNLFYRVKYWWYNGQSDDSDKVYPFLNDC